MLEAFKTIGRSIFARGKTNNHACIRLWPGVAIATFVFALASVSAHAEDRQQFYVFKSVLSSGDANWCIDIPGGRYQAGTQLQTANCTGTPNQTFGDAHDGYLTAGGFCVDGQPPRAGGQVVIADCEGS